MVAVAPQDLHRLPGHLHRHAAGEELGGAGLEGEPLPGILFPGGLQHQGPGGGDFHVHVSDLEGDGLVLPEFSAELLPLIGIGLGDLKGPPGDAHRLGRHPDPSRIQARQGVGQAPSLLAQKVFLGHEDPLEANLGGVGGVEAHLRLRGAKGKARGILLHQEGADALLTPGHDHVEVGLACGGDPAFQAVQHETPGHPSGLRADAGGIGTRLGLGEAEGPDPLPPGQGHQVPSLLRLGAEAKEHVLGKAAGHRKDHGHAGIGGGDLLEGQGPGHGIQAHSSPFLRGGHAQKAQLRQSLQLGPGVFPRAVVLRGQGVKNLLGHLPYRVQHQFLLGSEGHQGYRITALGQKNVMYVGGYGRARMDHHPSPRRKALFGCQEGGSPQRGARSALKPRWSRMRWVMKPKRSRISLGRW
ncbi:hypothetical protein HRbin38_00464 [bacterium HR38]|nr:hypothetical protein HRbin38_00464 [bacterium HR38]